MNKNITNLKLIFLDQLLDKHSNFCLLHHLSGMHVVLVVDFWYAYVWAIILLVILAACSATAYSIDGIAY